MKNKKDELLEAAKAKAKEVKKFTLELLVEEEGRGIEICRLPPYHCMYLNCSVGNAEFYSQCFQ